MMSYDFKTGLMPVVEPKLTMPTVETSANQQHLLEQLLFALTNQLAMAAQTNNNNMSQNFTSPSMSNAFKTNSSSNQPINKYINSGASPKRANFLPNNNQSDFERNTSPLKNVIKSDASRVDFESKSSEPKLKRTNNSSSNHHHHQERPKSTSNELTSIESFNLDTHLDLNRYMYFNSNQAPTAQQTFHRQASLTEGSSDATILENCLTVDCNFASSVSSCQLSSSSCSSSNSSISTMCKDSTTRHHTGPNQFIRPVKMINKLNELVHKKRPISYLANTKLNGHLSSSSDCLSGDEGYFGSYSDTKINLNQHQAQATADMAKQQTIPSNAISQQEQVVLLNYLLQNQQNTSNSLLTNSANEFQVSNVVVASDSNNNIETLTQVPDDRDTLDKTESSIDIPCLNMFGSAWDEGKDIFTPDLSPDDCLYYSGENEDDKFDVSNFFTMSEKNFNKLQQQAGDIVLDGLHLKEEIVDIINEQRVQRVEREKLEDAEMRSYNWRRLLDQRCRMEQFQRELSMEDHIDSNAYLNEIEMNVDHFQSAEDMLASMDQEEDMFIDTLLKFRTNRMAFNLRNYHRTIELQREAEQERLRIEEINMKSNMFANIDVDFIPEFTPFGNQEHEQQQYYGVEYDPEQGVEYTGEEYEQVYQQLDEMDEYQMLENDYTMVNEEKVYDENGYLVSEPQNSGVEAYEIDELAGIDSADLLIDSADSEYQYEEDYEDYEDQLMVDSLSEQDALNLLRNESEMYALQMAQASKSGLLPKTKSSRKKKGRYNSGNSSTTTQSTDTNSSETSSKLESASSTVDIFENVFNFEDIVRSTTAESNSDLASSSASISGTTESEACTNFDLEINEFFMPQFDAASTASGSGNGNISMSLRNSLLKLRHTRRHLAKLIDSKKPASDSSSTSSSLTNSSGTPLGTQFTKQMTISALSRKPCVYMLNEGRCMRADCRFAHDLKQITCKYWIDGECLKGENCEFLHEMLEETTPQPLSSKAAKKAPKALVVKKKDFKLDTEEFPALGGGPAPCVPKPVEFPPLGSSPVSAMEALPKDSQPVSKKTTLTADVPVFVSKTISPLWTIDTSASKVKTAASVLKNTPSAPVNAVNIVSNKAQQVKSNTQSQKIKQKATNADPSPNTPKDRKSSQAKSQALSAQKQPSNNSCGSSSSQSSSCSSLSGNNSRGSSVVRHCKK